MRLKLFNLLGWKVKSVSSWLDRQINGQLGNITYKTDKRDKISYYVYTEAHLQLKYAENEAYLDMKN